MFLPSAESRLPWPQAHSWSSCRPQGRGVAAAGGGHGWVRQRRQAAHYGLVLRPLVEAGRAGNSGSGVAVRDEQVRPADDGGGCGLGWVRGGGCAREARGAAGRGRTRSAAEAAERGVIGMPSWCAGTMRKEQDHGEEKARGRGERPSGPYRRGPARSKVPNETVVLQLAAFMCYGSFHSLISGALFAGIRGFPRWRLGRSLAAPSWQLPLPGLAARRSLPGDRANSSSTACTGILHIICNIY